MRICGPHAASRTRVLTVPGQEAVLDREQARRRLDDARRAERVAGDSLGRAGVGRAGKRRATSAASTSSFLALAVPCRLMWSIAVGVDAGAGQRVVERALGAEALGCGVDMWCASLDSP